MEKENITPEERLLKIIENPQGQKGKILSPGKTFGIDVNALSAGLKAFRFDKSIFKRINFQLINKGMLGLCAIFTLFAIFNFVQFKGYLAKQLKKVIAEANAAPVNQAAVALPDININQTLELSRRRNLFSFIPPVPETGVGITLNAAQTVGALKLVGIIWSDNPQAMIEDTKGQKTYLLSVGELVGGLTIKKILKDKVVLGQDKQEWELR